MIITESVYNPLEEIFKQELEAKYLTTETLDIVQRELFKAGIVPENAQEFTKVISLLNKVKKEAYGEK